MRRNPCPTHSPAIPGLLTQRDILARFNCPQGSLPLRIARGQIPHATGRVGPISVWSVEAVDAWLARSGEAA